MQEYSYVQELSYKWLHLEAYVAAVRMEGFDFSFGGKMQGLFFSIQGISCFPIWENSFVQ